MHHILIPKFACVVAAPVKDQDDYLQMAIDEGYPIIYIVASNGDKFVRRTLTGLNSEGKARSVTMKIPSIPGFKMGETTSVKEDNGFLPDGKIPIELLIEVQKFFKSVIAKFGDRELEAMIWIMWNAEQGYFLHVPDQVVAGASVKYEWGNLPANSIIVVDIHSHANFSAFFSGTDNGDDANTIRYSGVIGHNRRPEPEMKFRFNFMDVKKDVTVAELFHIAVPEVQDTPTEWLDKVKVTTYTPPTTYHGSHNYSGRGYAGSGGNAGSGQPSTWGLGTFYRDPTKYKAPPPSNARSEGMRGGQRGWFLNNGRNFITFDEWEEEYPAAIAKKEAEDAKKADKAAKSGGQQGTGPLELGARETEQSSLFPKEGHQSVEASNSPKLNESAETKLLPSSSEAALKRLGMEINSNPSNQASPTQTTSSSSGPSTPLYNAQMYEREMNKAMQGKTLTSVQTTNSTEQPSSPSASTPTTSTHSTGTVPSDPLASFTEPSELDKLIHRPVSWVSTTDEDGFSILRQVEVVTTGVKGAQDVISEEDQATYQEELRDSQKALQTGSKAALLEDTAKAPMGVIPVEIAPAVIIPTLIKKVAQTGSREVSPLGESFSSASNAGTNSPVLQPTPEVLVPRLQQSPQLARRGLIPGIPTTTGLTNHSTGWLDLRAERIQRELNLANPIEDAIPIFRDSAVERMHRRAAGEDALSDAEELAELQAGMTALFQRHTASGIINVLPDNTVTLTLEENDIPVYFDSDCVEYGKKVAGAKAILNVAIKEICDNGELMKDTLQGFFELIPEEYRLKVFRTLANSLPSKARESLEHNGL